MSRGANLLCACIVGLIASHSIAASINPALVSRKDTFTQYLLKKVPGNVRSAVEQYLKQHPKLTAMGKHIYEYRYLLGAAALLGGGYMFAPRRGKNRRETSNPDPKPFSGGTLTPSESGPRPEPMLTPIDFDALSKDLQSDQLLTPIDFDALSKDLQSDQLVQKMRRETEAKNGDRSYRESYFSPLTKGEFLDTLSQELRNPAQKQLFCRLMHQLNHDRVNLGLANPDDFAQDVSLENYFSESYPIESFGNQDLFFFSQHPRIRKLLDPIESSIAVSPPIQAKVMYLKAHHRHGTGVTPQLTDEYFEEREWRIEDKVYFYYKWPIQSLLRTFFGTCEGMQITRMQSMERLFEGLLYKFIKVIAQYPEIISQMQNKKVVVDYKKPTKYKSDDASMYREMGVFKEDDSQIYKGENLVGRMLTYIVQQILLPENWELLRSVIAKHYRLHALILNKSGKIPASGETLSGISNIIFRGYLPTSVRPALSQPSATQGQP